MTKTRAVLTVVCLWLARGQVEAQPAAVWAGANDAANTLITGVFDGAAMSYLAEVPSGGSANGGAGYVESQVRVFAGRTSGRCSLVAQTNPTSANVSVYTIGPTGAASPVPGSPFALGVTGGSMLAWARDGQALYAGPRAAIAAGTIVTFRVACTPGGPVSVTNAGTVTLASLSGMNDIDLSPSGGHLCASGDFSNTVGCFPIDPVTRVPATTAVNAVTVASAHGLRIAGNGCGVVGVPASNLVRGLSISGGGLVALANTATHVGPPAWGAVSPDGTFAAFGTDASTRRVALYTVAPATCQVTLAGTTAASPGPGAPYVAMDGANRLYVADVQANQVRVFQAAAGGPGAAISTTTTNHATLNPPIGIDAALLSSVPVELVGFAVE